MQASCCGFLYQVMFEIEHLIDQIFKGEHELVQKAVTIKNTSSCSTHHHGWVPNYNTKENMLLEMSDPCAGDALVQVCFSHAQTFYGAVLPFWPKYRLGHPENYLFSLPKKIFSGSKYPKIKLLDFEKGSTAMENSHRRIETILFRLDFTSQ